MKRTILLALPRLVLAAGLIWWIVAHQHAPEVASGRMVVDQFSANVVALLVVLLIVAGGSVAQNLLRKKPLKYTVFADIGLWLLIFGGFGILLTVI